MNDVTSCERSCDPDDSMIARDSLLHGWTVSLSVRQDTTGRTSFRVSVGEESDDNMAPPSARTRLPFMVVVMSFTSLDDDVVVVVVVVVTAGPSIDSIEGTTSSVGAATFVLEVSVNMTELIMISVEGK